MARLRRRWRVAKWAGAVVLLLLAVVWTVSLRWRFGWDTLDRSRHYHFGASFQVGALYVAYLQHRGEDVYGFSWAPDNFYPEFIDFPRILLKPHGFFAGYLCWSFALPLWIPFVAFVVPTVLLWWRDRRLLPPHGCQGCGYDLTGNTSGVCPECGQQVAGE